MVLLKQISYTSKYLFDIINFNYLYYFIPDELIMSHGLNFLFHIFKT